MRLHRLDIPGVPARLPPHAAGVRCLTISPDGLTLAAGHQDGTVKLFQAATGRELLSLRAGDKQLHGLAFAPNSRCLAVASHEGVVTLWDAAAP